MNKKLHQNEIEIEKQIMSKIKSGDIRMKSKAYYLVLGIAASVATIVAIIIASYSISIVSLLVRLQLAKGPAYGVWRNLDSLLGSFPWLALVIGILSIGLAIYLVSRSGRMYKLRLAYLIPVATIIILAISLALSYSSLPNIFTKNRNRENSPSVRGYQRNK